TKDVRSALLFGSSGRDERELHAISARCAHPIWLQCRVGFPDYRRHFGYHPDHRAAWQDRWKRYRSAKGHLSGHHWNGKIASNRSETDQTGVFFVADLWAARGSARSPRELPFATDS